jgi:hypothetical protein
MMCRLLASVAEAAHDRLLGKLLDQYEQKDQLVQQLEGITKLQVRHADTCIRKASYVSYDTSSG